MAEPQQPPATSIVDKVKIGSPPLSEAERKKIQKTLEDARTGNALMIERLNGYGVAVDAGLEALRHFQHYLVEIGVITDDQRLAAEAMWAVELHNQLRTSLQSLAEQQQAAQQRLITPPQGTAKLFVPGQG